MDDLSFINNQIKFMYGKYYDKIINNEKFICKELKNNSILVSNCLNNVYDECYNIEKHGLLKVRECLFIKLLKKYWNKDAKNYIITSNWNDGLKYVYEFVITYNRLFNDKDQIIFPLVGYHLPNDWNMKIEDTVNFNQKTNKLLWRGSATGGYEIENNKRYNIISKNVDIHENIDIGFTNLIQPVYINNKQLFERLSKPSLYKGEQIKHKFILNIEGNDCSSSFPWVLASNCCPLHNYPFTFETYIFGQGLQPYVHFIPVNNDGTDLLEKYAWCLNNLDKCEEIANNGKIYMEKYLRQDLFDTIMIKFFELYPLSL